MRFIVVLILSLFSFVCDAQFMQFAPKKAPAPFELLDTFGTGNQYAFSFYRLRSNYTGDCILVRRSNDNATKRIGFTCSEDLQGNTVCFLDTADLKTFVGANDGFVVRWYNQSPNNSDSAVQATNANQPRIVNSGVVERSRGIVSLFFDGSNDVFRTANATPLESVSNSAFAIICSQAVTTTTPARFAFDFRFTVADVSMIALSNSGAQSGRLVATYRRVGADGSTFHFFDNAGTQPRLWGGVVNYGTPLASSSYQNVSIGSSALASSGVTANDVRPIAIGSGLSADNISVNFWNGHISEFIVWNNNQAPNQARINTNINRRYKLY